MTNNIKSSIYFSHSIQPDSSGIALTNPFRVLTTPFMPTLLSLGITFIITGLDDKPGKTFQVTLKRKDNEDIVFKSDVEKMEHIDPYNTVINFNFANVEFSQTTGGDYEASIEIKNKDKEQIFLGKETFAVIETE